MRGRPLYGSMAWAPSKMAHFWLLQQLLFILKLSHECSCPKGSKIGCQCGNMCKIDMWTWAFSFYGSVLSVLKPHRHDHECCSLQLTCLSIMGISSRVYPPTVALLTDWQLKEQKCVSTARMMNNVSLFRQAWASFTCCTQRAPCSFISQICMVWSLGCTVCKHWLHPLRHTSMTYVLRKFRGSQPSLMSTNMRTHVNKPIALKVTSNLQKWNNF